MSADPDFESTQTGIPLLEDLSPSENEEQNSTKRKSTKRKRDADADDPAAAKKAARKKSRREKKRPADIEDSTLDAELGINHAIGHMDSRLLADHVAQRTRRFRPDASLLEVEESFLPEKAILDTTSYDQPRTTENMPSFLERFVGSRRNATKPALSAKGSKDGVKPETKGKNKKSAGGGKKNSGDDNTLAGAPSTKGAPHTLVIAGAGLRAADVTRALRQFQTRDAMVAKLFAKHIKLKEAIEMAKTTRMSIGVGTPQRVMDLLDNGALSAAHLERIVIDASHIDQKKRGILDMKETQLPLVQLLTRADFRERYGTEVGERRVELLFF